MIQKILSSRSKSWILVIAVLVVAAFFRLYRISDYMTFLGDEGRDALVVKRILIDHKFTLLGPVASVGGFFLGPVYYYFMAPFLWAFNYDPVGPAVMVALFGTAAVYLTYQTGRVFFNRNAGLIAAFLYAISPLAVTYSRSSWNPNLVPFFSLALMLLLYYGVKTGRSRYFLSAGIMLGISIQLHYLTLFLVPAVVIYLWLILFAEKKFRLPVISKRFILLFLGFITGYSPFLLFEARHGFVNTQNVIRFIFGSTGDTGFSLIRIWAKAIEIFHRLFLKLVVNYPTPRLIEIKNYSQNVIGLWSFFAWVLGFSSLVFVFFNRNRRAALLLLSWLFVCLSLFGFYKREIYDYYLGLIFPMPFLLAGNLIAGLRQGSRAVKVIGAAVLLVIVYLNLLTPPSRFDANRQRDQIREISRFVYDKTEGKPYNFALLASGNTDHAYRYFLELWGRPPIVIENPDIDPERKTVTDQLFVVCELRPCSPPGHSLWEIAGFGRPEIVEEWDVSLVRVVKLRHYL